MCDRPQRRYMQRRKGTTRPQSRLPDLYRKPYRNLIHMHESSQSSRASLLWKRCRLHLFIAAPLLTRSLSTLSMKVQPPSHMLPQWVLQHQPPKPRALFPEIMLPNSVRTYFPHTPPLRHKQMDTGAPIHEDVAVLVNQLT